MSNFDDPRMRNGWAEYQRLVLAELERHNKMIQDVVEKLGEINISIALLKEENGKIKDINRRIGLLETTDATSNAVGKYRKWFIGTGILLVSSILIPIIKIVFFPGI